MTKEKPALPPRPNFVPPKPSFFKAKSQLNVKIDDVPTESEAEAEAEYDEPRPAAKSTNWDVRESHRVPALVYNFSEASEGEAK